ncbi:chromosomal replication initiator protein DnaA [Nocardia terpenica]|uniref:chromosomal replication initiator protein DnaA n=1 Tax=Nocardia terpenica TaxID=455432 RepID=UPI0018955E8A|nr:chromosomal replication initiator protein DnaA [Nocardia terpenica]MBF6063133.1 chromosomal replication initiator protein DnaA [Nocardia terpenica]MBF6104732.1 chromosomal replication initiator protein DnaA [Nocardia terpenica]MBF6112832.1 chromosomal replication initiator protein DnaA [Nocardia terpenica]MBF6118460.1 chromosomal replication initiator protein DnaA [Nocardia terpenica]MBF6154939.1 chromosomal replication initiator protein DnaA [Nocardia terpenica]
MDDEQNVLTSVWPEVVAELTTGSADGAIPPVTNAQKAWLGLVKPLTVAQGFALLSVPSSLAQEAIERDLREPILRSLARRLGPQVEGLGVRIAAPTAQPGDRPAGPPRHARLTSRPDRGREAPREPVNYAAPQDYPAPADYPAPRYLNPADYPARPDYPQGDYPSTPMAGELPEPGAPESPAPAGRELDRPPGRGESSAGQESLFASEPEAPARRPEPPADDEPVVNVRNSWPTYFSKSPEPAPTAPASASASLNAKYTFETFVIGASNRFAHAAAVAIAEAPARAYNPLFVWGASGLGKTHLLHAAGHYAQRLFPGMRVKYVSTEEFTNDFINSLRDDRKVAFKRRYRETDILLVDDIQFIEGKEGIQEEFFHTFNTLHNANKQIVVSSDRPPKQLATLEERLRTRFEWGLITDVQPPELETRIAILRKKARMDRLDVPHDVLELIASRVERNIRELEGALIRVTAFASLNGQPLDLSLAEVVLRDLMPDTTTLEITASTIMAVTAEYFNTTLEELTGPGKARPLAQARQIAMYLCRELTDLSLPKIGQAFGRDHTTVMYAEKKVRKEMTERRRVYDQVQELTARIKQRSR